MKNTIVVLLLLSLSLIGCANAQEIPQESDALNVREGFVTTDDGVRLFFQTTGSGKQTIIAPNAIYLFDDFRRVAAGRRLIAYDLRNRGRSDPVDDRSKLSGGIHRDVDDLEAVRRQVAGGAVDVIGHSYVGVVAALYAMKHPAHVNRVIQIGPAQPDFAKQYPAQLTGADSTSAEVFTTLGQMQKEAPAGDPKAICERWWSVLRLMYVADRGDVDKISRWGFCDLPNERNMLRHFNGNILPTLKSLKFAADDVAKASMPTLIIHGRADRNAPYGGGRDWAALLPNARLLTVENAAHAPWVEAPDFVFDAIERFLSGRWPPAAEEIR
ncbi:MAG: alpha/beta fold hydrolase [Steroidobacter sp.]